MNFNKEYTHIIPIGSNCRIGIALRDCGFRMQAMPFDWMLSTMKSINELFKSDFDEFVSKKSCVQKVYTFKSGTSHHYLLNERYNLNITHENALTKECIDKYANRVVRMYDILNNKNNKVLFIRNNLDGIIHDEMHQYYLSTEKHYSDFKSEHIDNFNIIISSKFDLDYDILVINHTKKMKFESENIYNVTSSMSQEDRLWDQQVCAEIVKKIKLKKDE